MAVPSVKSVRIFFVEPFGLPRFRFTGVSVGNNPTEQLKKGSTVCFFFHFLQHIHLREQHQQRHYSAIIVCVAKTFTDLSKVFFCDSNSGDVVVL